MELINVKKHKLSSLGTVFYYEDNLYAAWDPVLPLELVHKLPIQKLEKTDFIYKNKPVWKLKEYKHRIRIQESTKKIVKQFIIDLCNINIATSQYHVFINDIHEGNINYTKDGILWLDIGALSINDDASNVSLNRICYFIDKYLFNTFKPSYENYNSHIMNNSKSFVSELIHMNSKDPNTWKFIKQKVIDTNVKLKESNWYHNYSNNMDIDNPKNVNEKAVKVANIIKNLKFKSVTDMACNKGYYALYAAKFAEEVIGLDLDEHCVQEAIDLSIKRNANAIFAVKDLVEFCKCKLFEYDRYSSDLVLALAIVHHITNKISIKDFANSLANISNKYILIEDIGTAQEYETEFNKLGFKLNKRTSSFPQGRTLSLYEKEL